MNQPFAPLVPLHPQCTHRVDFVGNQKQPVLVIDNFLAGAESLVDYAERTGGFSRADSYYPGQRAPAPELYIQTFHYHLHNLVRDVFGLQDEWVTGVKADFSMVTTPPEELTRAQALPHVDSTNGRELAAVHYLCDEAQGGTSLYRHISTGFETITPENLARYKEALNADCAINPVGPRYMNGDSPIFQQIATYAARFNRIIIYPCNLLHSGNIPENFTFNANPRSGRLTLNTFIYARAD